LIELRDKINDLIEEIENQLPTNLEHIAAKIKKNRKLSKTDLWFL